MLSIPLRFKKTGICKMTKWFLAVFMISTLAGCASVQSPADKQVIVTDETFGRYHEELEPALILITMAPEYHARYTQLKPMPMSGDLPSEYAQFLQRIESAHGVKRVANWPLPAINIFCVVFEVQDSRKRDSVAAALEKEPDIETAQIVQSFESQEQVYNDPYLSLQHGFHSIQANSSHRWSRGKGVMVAVIDTGMDNTHSDLQSSSLHTVNFVDDDEHTFRSDKHGTAVGGVIAAKANNATGMVGMAPDASLLAIKACWHFQPNDSRARCNTLTLAKALNYAIRQKADVINLSLTGPPDPILERLVREALSLDVVVVGAKPAHERAAFPVSIPGTIVVDMPGYPSSALTAPGRRVLSTIPDDEYDFFDGSSFATAHIAGLAALVRSLSPMTSEELQQLLETTADPGTREVNACRVVETVGRADYEALGNSQCQ